MTKKKSWSFSWSWACFFLFSYFLVFFYKFTSQKLIRIQTHGPLCLLSRSNLVNFTNFCSCEAWLGYRLYSSLLHDKPFYNLRIVNEIRKQLQYLWLKSPLVVWELLASHTWPNILLAFSTNSVQFVQVHACTQLIWIKWSEMMKQIHWIISLHAKWAHGLFF